MQQSPTSRTGLPSPHTAGQLTHRRKLISRLVLAVCCLPYLSLLFLSLGSGWSYPNLAPDNLDLRPWLSLFESNHQLISPIATSILLACGVATLSTLVGLFLARQIDCRERLPIFLIYLPFTCSPVIVGSCLLDLFIRIDLASTTHGVFLIQSLFGTSFATILFLELRSRRIESLEYLVKTLGGTPWDCWRHAIWPQLWKLATLCWLQTFLFSWLDYGFTSTLGGGVVPSLTLQVVSYIREASINKAAQASVLLMLPPVATLFIAFCLFRNRLPHSH